MTDPAVDTAPNVILARLDRIPVWPYPRRVLAIVGAGIFFAFFDIVTIAEALPVLVDQMHVTASEASRAITSSLFGYILGAFLVSRLADRIGRRVGLLVSVLLFSGGSIMTAFSQELWHVVFWRFISGMGIGADIAGLTTYLAEVSPKRIRGRYTAIAVGCGFLGLAAVPFIAEGLVPRYDWGWRALFAVGGIGGVLIAFGRRGLVPSPRWLVARGRDAEALAVVAAAERRAVDLFGGELPAPELEASVSQAVPVRALLRSPHLGRIATFVSIWGLYYLGNYAWLSLMPELYVKRGIELSQSLWITGITSLGFVAGSILAVVVVERVERKWTCAGVAAVWSLLLLVVGWLPSVPVVMVAGFLASASISLLIPIMYTYTGESFPTSIRATSVALSDGLGHIGGMICAPVVLGVYRAFDAGGFGYQAALTAMALSGMCAALILTTGPRVTGKAL